ncbi:MAG: hypothetical protein EOP84_11060 [Verrucomicrobiaceae bacterium]|nr:MAG: hypothetical protein EOP84_11060 [Verrucomicrobiaceae bacterium]
MTRWTINFKKIGWIADARYDPAFCTKRWNQFDAELTEDAKLWIEQSESATVEIIGLHAMIKVHTENDKFHFKLKWL